MKITKGANNANPRGVFRILTAVSALLYSTSFVTADTYTWDGNGTQAGSKNWNVANSWAANVAPPVNSAAHDFVFAGSFKLANTMEASYTVGGISFASGAGAFTLGNNAGTTLTIGNLGFVNNSIVNQTISISDLSLSASQTWNAASGALTFNGAAINLGANALSLDGANAIAIANAIGGTGSLTKNGAGTTTLSGANTYAGSTYVNAGTLNVNSAGALGGTDAIHLNGGFLALGGVDPLDRISDAATIIMNGGTLVANDLSEGFGNLDLRLDSFINLSAGGAASVLTFAGGTYSSGILTITGWTGAGGASGTDDRIIFTTDPGSEFLANIHFTGFDPGAMWLPGGEIVPVPEVNTAVLLGLGFVAMGAYRWNNRRKQA